MTRTLKQIPEWRGKLSEIRYDIGLEDVTQRLVDWANERQITLMYIQPGKPTQNAYIERINRTVRHEWLDMHHVESIEHDQDLTGDWLRKYYNVRPNSAIGGVSPSAVASSLSSTNNCLGEWGDHILTGR